MIKYHEDSAIFTDQDKTTIVVNVQEGDNIFSRAIEVTPSPVFDEFIKQVSLEKVENNTNEYHKEVREEEKKYERDLLDRLKKEISIPKAPEGAPVVASFDPSNLTTEDLFKLKLQSFEIDEVKSSKNRELKARIRKSNSFMEVVAFTTAVILDSKE